MRADDGQHPCREAEVYYYDLTSQDEAAIPDFVRRHVAACPACQEQIHRLREILRKAEQGPTRARGRDSETIAALARQFQLLDEHVTCCDVKPFLPQLAMASPQIRIPTPVTVHVDYCSLCADDVTALRELNLTTDQLQRLSGLFESGHGEGLLPPGGLDWTSRATTPKAPATEAPREGIGIACGDISNADLFDVIIPDTTRADARHLAITAHLRACPACRTRAETVQDTLRRVLKRADSETTTVYRTQSDAENARRDAEAPYPYPIDVQVLHNAKEEQFASSESADVPARGRNREKTAGPLLRAQPLARVAAVAFALVALLLLRWVNVPTASGTSVDDLLKPLSQVRSVHVLTTYRGGGPVHEFWINYHSNRMVLKTTQQFVLYDFEQGRRRTIEPETGVGPAVKMSRDEYNRAREFMVGRLQNMMERVSPNAKLHPSTGTFGAATEANLDIYETTWAARSVGSSLRCGWRAYIDRATGLPQKTEFYQERHGDAGATYWDHITTTVFMYPTEQEMDRTIDALFPTP